MVTTVGRDAPQVVAALVVMADATGTDEQRIEAIALAIGIVGAVMAAISGGTVPSRTTVVSPPSGT